MKRRINRPVMTSELREMRRLRALGMSYAAIAKAIGRPPETVRHHASDVAVPVVIDPATIERMRVRLSHNEQLYRKCNRALAEVRL